jgi:hypothetical protein
MPTITITIDLDVPDGTEVNIATTQPGPDHSNGIPADVHAAIERLVPSRYRAYFEMYISRAILEQGCTAEIPDNPRKDEYLNVYPPARCRRSRVSGITYSSSRTALYTGAIDLSGYEHAVETLNSGTYAYPKVPHLDSVEAVDEALKLTAIAIERLER